MLCIGFKQKLHVIKYLYLNNGLIFYQSLHRKCLQKHNKKHNLLFIKTFMTASNKRLNNFCDRNKICNKNNLGLNMSGC